MKKVAVAGCRQKCKVLQRVRLGWNGHWEGGCGRDERKGLLMEGQEVRKTEGSYGGSLHAGVVGGGKVL